MGSISDEESISGLEGSLLFFREYLYNVKTLKRLSIRNAYVLVIVLGLYLYSRYYRCGTKCRSSYNIISGTVSSMFSGIDDKLVDYVYSVIKSRNDAVHRSFLPSTDNAIMTVVCNYELLLKLLRIEKIVDKDWNFIEPESGKYEAVNNREEAIAYISNRLVEMGKEDEEDKEGEENPTPSLDSAISKMGK